MDKKEDFLSQKAFEIGYAIFRVSALMKGRALAAYLENRALQLVDSVSSGEHDRAFHALNSLNYLIHLGVEAGEISTNAFTTLSREIANFQNELSKVSLEAKLPEVDLEPIFSSNKKMDEGALKVEEFLGKEGITEESISYGEKETTNFLSNNASVLNKEKTKVYSGARANDSEEESLKPAISGNAAKHYVYSGFDRQAVILDTVKESGYCRLRDLQEIFPEISERTIRYDLEKLSNQGLIEKVGNGGPATYYRIKREIS